jgi:hypothetical protein
MRGTRMVYCSLARLPRDFHQRRCPSSVMNSHLCYGAGQTSHSNILSMISAPSVSAGRISCR